ncbi:TetR/AcrR family transcriptional regulator [Corynebacterium sp. H130]|uniref:TetR/AcrR family transcriptional regulator n=1 Tax=Corynebacterium sp. H130 TaxID=3133444 RepID=UPI00309A5538
MFTEHVHPTLRAHQRQQTESKILEVSRELFDSNGFSETSIRDIAKQAGVSVGTVMKCGSKQSLLIRVVEDWISEIHNEITGLSLTSSIESFLEFFTDHDELSRAYCAALINESSDTLSRLKPLFLDMAEREGMASGDVLYDAYLGILIGWAAGLYSTTEAKSRISIAVRTLEAR